MKINKKANQTQIFLSQHEWETMGKKAKWMKTANKLDEPIIPQAIRIMEADPRAVQFNDKISFQNFLKQQQYFSASYSHCYYSEEDLQMAREGHPKFRDGHDGTKGISEADKGCIMLFETGHELVAVWDEKNQTGYVVPSKN